MGDDSNEDYLYGKDSNEDDSNENDSNEDSSQEKSNKDKKENKDAKIDQKMQNDLVDTILRKNRKLENNGPWYFHPFYFFNIKSVICKSSLNSECTST